MKIFNTIILIILIVGALNWGMIGFFNINVITLIFSRGLSQILFGVIGIAGLFGFLFFKKVICTCKECSFKKK